jgi:hypothetical protein
VNCIANFVLEDSFSRIKSWISPPEFAAEFDKAQKERENGTAEWLFDDFLFASWVENRIPFPSCVKKNEFGENALWIKGNMIWHIDALGSY